MARLYSMARELSQNEIQSSLRGKALRLLPTTLAGTIYSQGATSGLIDSLVFWKGDSRCYAWHEQGLLQLSKDDLKTDVDPLEAVQFDAQISGYLNEKESTNLNMRHYTWSQPVTLLVASDGFYDYCRSPDAC